ncbi:prepilin-type N-terminal cleavage/methylation domain-containing protein [Pseudomonas qingdaonensis]|nr:prepilin-type N-terminal cleavage/methylation domain-containing protein [Pseudomonas qingdaonensis]
MPRTHQGLSLIELLIVVAVVGILAGIAYPSYRDTVKRAARSEVVGLLFDSAQHLERHRARTGQYADTDAVITPLPPAQAITACTPAARPRVSACWPGVTLAG